MTEELIEKSTEQLIEEFKEWVEKEHNDQLFKLSRHQYSSDLAHYLMLQKLLELGLISEFTLEFATADECINGQWRETRHFFKYDKEHLTGIKLTEEHTTS
jgi:hypothetical protein